MPIQISLCNALDNGLDDLLPNDFQAFVQRIEVDLEDEGPWKVFADWLSEQGEPELEFAIRWCVARHLVPMHERERYGSKIVWRWAEWWRGEDRQHRRAQVPAPAREWVGDCVSETLMGLMAKTAKALLEKQREYFGFDPLPMPEVEADETPAVPAARNPPGGDDEEPAEPTHDIGDPGAVAGGLVEVPVSSELTTV